MNFHSFLISLIILAVGAFCPASAGEDPLLLRRMALIVGANNGGRDRVTLKYAHTDARAFARVMRELGGVQQGDITLLLEPTRVEFEKALKKVHAGLDKAGTGHRRLELVVYYSQNQQ